MGIHISRTESPEKGDHVLHELLPREKCEYQLPPQWGCGEGNERCVSCALLFIRGDGVEELEVLEVLEESNGVQDLSGRSVGLFGDEESEGR